MLKETMSSLPSIEVVPAEGHVTELHEPRLSNENSESLGNRLLHLEEHIGMVTDSPTIVKSRSLTKKIRERQSRDNNNSSGYDSEKGIPSIHMGRGPSAVRDSASTNLDDGIAAVNAENSLFSSSGKHIPSVQSTPNRTRANSSSATNDSSFSEGIAHTMPSLALHSIAKSTYSSSDNLADISTDSAKSRNLESPVIPGGSPPGHSLASLAHLPPTSATLKQLTATPIAHSLSMPNAHTPSHYGANGSKAPERNMPKALEKLNAPDGGSGSSHSASGGRAQHQHQRSGSGSTVASGGSSLSTSSKLSALTHSPAAATAKSRVSSSSASTMLAVHGLAPTLSGDSRQHLLALEVTTKPSGEATVEEDIDRIVQERLQEAKALDRKNTSGAVMHQFSLWSKAQPQSQPTAALRSQSEPGPAILLHASAGIAAASPLNITHPIMPAEDVHLTPRSSHKNKLAALHYGGLAGAGMGTGTGMSAMAAENASSASKKTSKVRGPKAVRKIHTTGDDEANLDLTSSPVNTTVTSEGNVRSHSLNSSRDLLDEEYTMEFEAVAVAAAGGDDSGKQKTAAQDFHSSGNSSLAASLRRKVGGAKLPELAASGTGESANAERKQDDAAVHVYTTPEKKASPAVVQASSSHQSAIEALTQEGSDDEWYSEEFAEEDDAGVTQRSSGEKGQRPRSAGNGASAETAAILSMSQSGPAAFAAHKVSASLDVSLGRTEANFAADAAAAVNAIDAAGGAPALAMRRATTSGDSRHFVDKLEHLVSSAGGDGGGSGALLKSMTSRSASECNISFDPVASSQLTKGSSSKYQTLRNLKSSKAAPSGAGSEQTSTSVAAVPEAAPAQHDIPSVETKISSPDVATVSKTLNPYTHVPILDTATFALNRQLDDTPTGQRTDRSGMSRDDASPTLSEMSDTEDAADPQTKQSPLRVDLEGNSERLSSERNVAENGDHEDSPLRWRKGEVIGEGTFGKVYRGLNEKTGESLAIKQLCLIDGSSLEVDSLRKEISVMWDLEHENIVRYLGTSKSERYLFIILEYEPGGSIASMISQFGAFNEKLIKRFSQHILAGVDYLHSKGIIHRDIKGANILVSGTGVAKLADFGCSKQLAGMCTASIEESMRAIRGSVPWMAPEVIKQSGHGRSSDIWSVGATGIEMATGKPPWPEFTNSLSALFHVATSKTPPPMPPQVSPLCCDFLSRCLVIEPSERATAQELLQDCEFLQSTSATPVPSSASAGNTSSRPRADSLTPGTTPRLP